MNYFVCVSSNIQQYEKNILKNTYLENKKLAIIPKLNKNNLKSPGKLFNEFLCNIPDDAEWILFFQDCIEFLDNPLTSLESLSKDFIYGPWGAKLITNDDNVMLQECIGQISVNETNESHSMPLYTGIVSSENCHKVDTLDSRCIAVHAQLIRNNDLRFNEHFNLLYGEFFCIEAMERYCIQSSTVPFDCCLHEPLFLSKYQLEKDIFFYNSHHPSSKKYATTHIMLGAEDHDEKPIFYRSKSKNIVEKVYSTPVSKNKPNLPIVSIYKRLKPKSRILDCGCACGDNGFFLKTNLHAELYGMDYSPQSLGQANKKNTYENLHLVDLNNFLPEKYSHYYHFFDYILLFDVLEHLMDPLEVMQKLKVFLKKDGAFVTSIPNIANIYPITNLLQQNFSYTKYGILDSTHIRFFTWKSIAVSMSKEQFKIIDSTVSFTILDTGDSLTPRSLPEYIYNYFNNNPHFYVIQYVTVIRPSDESIENLYAHNIDQLEKSVLNNPAGWKLFCQHMNFFNAKRLIAHGEKLDEASIQFLSDLCQQKNYIEAVRLSPFFDEYWYKDKYPYIDFSKISPILDYLAEGWKVGRVPGESFDSAWYLEQYPFVAESGQCPLLYHLEFGLKKGLHHNEKSKRLSDERSLEIKK